jgi:hypothetical protein
MIAGGENEKLPSIVFLQNMVYLSLVKSHLKHSILCLIIAGCASLGSPAQAHATSNVGYFTDAKKLPPPPSQQSWTQGNDIPSPTKTYHSPEVVSSASSHYPHHQDFFVAPIQLSISPLSQLTYFRSRPRDPPGL